MPGHDSSSPKPDIYIPIRSFLFSNVENLLENLNARRQHNLLGADDLFGSEVTSEFRWQTPAHFKSKLQILLEEKESLGLYVSGNPLEDYIELLEWLRDTLNREDIHLILIDKIRKIFTKSNNMMFALQITTPREPLEGIVFPKNALTLSPLLEEKALFWVKGKITRPRSKKEDSDTPSEEGEIKEFVELPKLIIDTLNPFEQGILSLFAEENIPLAMNREEMIKKLNWDHLKKNPQSLLSTTESKPAQTAVKKPAPAPKPQPAASQLTESGQQNPKKLRLAKSLGMEGLKQIKSMLRPAPFPGGIPVLVEIEHKDAWKKVKGDFWVEPQLVREWLS